VAVLLRLVAIEMLNTYVPNIFFASSIMYRSCVSAMWWSVLKPLVDHQNNSASCKVNRRDDSGIADTNQQRTDTLTCLALTGGEPCPGSTLHVGFYTPPTPRKHHHHSAAMAASRAKTPAVASAQWIQNEQDQANGLVEQEVEEFGYSVRNELEWLNEHMGDIFSSNHVYVVATVGSRPLLVALTPLRNFVDVFKTPGKLRGKTPRTARKRDALGPRQPLTDIFAPNTQSTQLSPQKNGLCEKVAHFQIAEDVEDQAPNRRPISRGKSPQRVGKPGNTDSGYHGMTEDEMEVDARTETATTLSSQQSLQAQKVPLRECQARPQLSRQDTVEMGQNSDESFMSAKEDQISRAASKDQLREEQDDNDNVADAAEEMDIDQQEVQEVEEAVGAATAAPDIEPEAMDQTMDEETSNLQSEASSPEKPLQRKSSFTFSALPARGPLNSKRSIDASNSQRHAEHTSALTTSLGGRDLGVPNSDEEAHEGEKPEEAKAYIKTSTQLLHERISMLGKAKEPRTSKSIPHSAFGAQATYPQLPCAEAAAARAIESDVQLDESADNATPVEDDDDDWIAPSKAASQALAKTVEQDVKVTGAIEGTSLRPGMHQKSISATNIHSPARTAMAANHTKAQSVSNPSLANVAGTIQSTTPAGSPMGRRYQDGPLSASKNKLWSALKSARNIFASSASASAAAKLEAHNHSPSVQRSPRRDFLDESKTAAVFNMPGALYSEMHLPLSPNKFMSVASTNSFRKTRNSSESQKKREKELKAQQKAAEDLEKAREKERLKATKQQDEKRKGEEADATRDEKDRKQAEAVVATDEQPVSAADANADESEMPPPPPPKSMLPAGKLRAPGRLVKPTRAEPAARPAPVSIRVASQSQRLGQAPASQSMSKSQHESLVPPPPPKTGLRTASAQGNVRSSTAPNNARVKALEAAARKKEADEKAAQRKAEQKREMERKLERKRAAKAEEERRAEEEREAAEQAARVHEAKLAAQRKQAEQQAAEARRREQQRLEQQRQQDEAQKARAAHELAEAIKRERAQHAPPHPRGDVGGTLRQLAKNTVSDQPARPALQPNPSKPAKRVFQPEDDEVQHAPPPQRPGMQRAPPSFQQNDAKRRRTNEDQEQPEERHSVMAPPKRPSNMRKVGFALLHELAETSLTNVQESTLSKFPHGYTHAPPPATHHTSSMFKATVTAQHQLQHAGKPVPSHPSQTVQISTARIPFAENANPPAAQHTAYQQQTHPGHENVQPGAANKYKTPARPAHASKSAKSSPMYPKGDNIQLPEIQTDSEDEDSEDEETGGFRAPSWVASPALRDLLTQQQLVDPETVFGPIGELKMDEVFKNGKNQDRLKRFRDRGSSAAWVETGDAVTSAEKRRDMEMREKVVREGGWRYEPNA